jgi:hypothetical protein
MHITHGVVYVELGHKRLVQIGQYLCSTSKLSNKTDTRLDKAIKKNKRDKNKKHFVFQHYLSDTVLEYLYLQEFLSCEGMDI